LNDIYKDRLLNLMTEIRKDLHKVSHEITAIENSKSAGEFEIARATFLRGKKTGLQATVMRLLSELNLIESNETQGD